MTPESGPWPASAGRPGGVLSLGGLGLDELARTWGTPLLVIDADEVRGRMRILARSFPRVAYAVKALSAHRLLRMAWEEGLDLLCCSGGEIEVCLRAGVPARGLQLHGNAKTDDELRLALDAGVSTIIVDNAGELERVNELAVDRDVEQPILLRLVPEVEVATHEAIATGHAASKFGIALAEAAGAARRARDLPGVRLDGFQAHAGSQVLDPAPFERVLEALMTVAADAGVPPAVLDVGGGFGVTYTDEPSLDVVALASRLRARVRELAGANGWPEPDLQVEPGRWIVANAGCTVYRVLSRKEVAGARLIAVDGGMSDNLRPMLYDARATVTAVHDAGPGERVTVVGRHCESGDVLAEDVELPATLMPGDLVAFAATGAYTYPLASHYNRFGRPAVVAIEGGLAQLWLRREDAADMDRLEAGAGRADRDQVEPPEGVTVRPARPSDAASFAAHWAEVSADEGSLRADPVAPRRVYARRFRVATASDEATIVATENDRVIGSVGLVREPRGATRHIASLVIAVDASQRGRGVGSALLSAAVRWARSQGVEKLLLSVYPDNTPAIALYRRFGFVEEGRLSGQSASAYGYRDEVLMAAWVGAEERPVGTKER